MTRHRLSLIHSKVLRELIEQDIIMAYYYQEGITKASLSSDSQYLEAERLLKNPDEYYRLLKK